MLVLAITVVVTDINECEVDPPQHNCEQVCVNDDVSAAADADQFHCTCFPGYELDTNLFACNGVYLVFGQLSYLK